MITMEVINNRPVWFYIDQLRTVDVANSNVLRELPRFVCYLKLSEPNAFILGELIRDEREQVVVFNSVDDALRHGRDYARRILPQ